MRRVATSETVEIGCESRQARAMTGPIQRIVFSDFDGTITAIETFFSMLQRFAPELTAQVVPEILAYRVPLSIGVRRVVETIPSHHYPAICEHARQAGLRPGFEDLLSYLEGVGVDLVVVSSGFEGMIRAALGPLVERVRAIYALDVDCAGPTLRVHSKFERGDELLAKVEVMRRFPCNESVAIGDSITDVKMAQAADIVFARDWLAEHLAGKGLSFEPWDDFHHVRRCLQKRWADRG